jgi:hypothetical protein
MKRPFPRRRTCTLTRPNIHHFIARWDDEEPPTFTQIAAGIIGHPACVEKRHIDRVRKLRPFVEETTDVLGTD